MNKFTTIVFNVMALMLLTVMMGCAAPPASDEELSFSIATGPSGGAWFPSGGAISSIINQYVPDTGQHNCGQWIVDHWLVVNRYQLFGHAMSDRI